ncbi:hypothetical protein [Roseicella aerolata]|uniref:Uncharacterized protein n=1 Tax=Roseicella aerolata TaxID=2883479 RepID=A0A9X1IEE0_9PROT|nr:hypothetical protein [Roseicella aerolata]MCB4821773.1 hypothetical protein [Roseicella aerolata]
MRTRAHRTRACSGLAPGDLPGARSAAPARVCRCPAILRAAEAGRPLRIGALVQAPPAPDTMVALTTRIVIEAGRHAPQPGGLP